MVGAPFLDVRKNLEKNATSKCGMTLSVCLLLWGNDDLEHSTCSLHNMFLDEENIFHAILG